MNKREIAPVNENRITPQWMRVLEVFIGSNGNDFALEQETKIEKALINILDELGISASVKKDKYSLPVEGVVVSSNFYQSFVNDIFDSSSVKRQFIKKLLDGEHKKVRFYAYVYTTESNAGGALQFLAKKYNIEIRYFIHH